MIRVYKNGELVSEQEMSDEDKLMYESSSAEALRNDRKILLEESDIEVMKYLEKGQKVPSKIVKYKQELRDISIQDTFPISVTWPKKPF